jgi:hypothetical protein
MTRNSITLTTVEQFYVWAQAQLSSTYNASHKYGLREWMHHEDVVDPNGNRIWTGEVYEHYKDADGNPEKIYLTALVPHYYLTSKDGRDYARDVVELPREIGEALARVWKQNQYQNFVGLRDVAGILKVLDAQLARETVARGQQRANLEKRIVDVNRRNSARAEIARQATALRDYIARSCLNDLNASTEEIGKLTLAELIGVAEALETAPTM